HTLVPLYPLPGPAHRRHRKRDYIRLAEAAHRRACLRVIGGRLHVSYEATYVLAGIPPLSLLADERTRLYGRRREDAKDEERLATLSKWQEAWDQSTKPRWTHRLIPNIRVWIEKRHGELNYHLTQLLTGHGFFKHHSQRYNHNHSAQRPVCPSSIENAEHVFYHCPRFNEQRDRLQALLHEIMTPENTTRLMLASEPNWLAWLPSSLACLTSQLCHHHSRQEQLHQPSPWKNFEEPAGGSRTTLRLGQTEYQTPLSRSPLPRTLTSSCRCTRRACGPVSFQRAGKGRGLFCCQSHASPPEEPSSYRPLCMLDTAGKILERITSNRLEATTESPGGLSDHHYGFRKGRSTINAVENVIATAREVIAGKRRNRGTKKYCAVGTLDSKNAFNSAR
ncbi:unnamed protein product, partial [Trichogramma brassicae]